MTAAAIAVRVTRFRCPFCRKSWSSKAAANAHVPSCWMDPGNRACKTCEHHVPAESGGCTERAGCGCQDIEEHCDAGVDMTIDHHVFDDEVHGKVTTVKRAEVQVNCPLWVKAGWVA